MRNHILLLFILFVFNLNAQDKGWNIRTTDVNADYTGIAIANGRIGMLSSKAPFQIKHIVLNNVYDVDPNLEVSQILHGMNFGNLDVYIDNEKITQNNISNWQQNMNMKEAAFTTSFQFEDKAKIHCTVYALRHLQYTGYIDIKIEPLKAIDVEVFGKIITPKNFKTPKHKFQILKDNETTMPILQSVAVSPFEKHKVATSGTFIWHNINSSRENQRPELHHKITSDYENTLSFKKHLDKGETLEFAWTGAECTTKDFDDPKSESERMVIFNLLNSRDVLLQRHKQEWAKLWEGDIIIEGDLTSQLDVRLALYHLYAFGRGDSNLSIAPMGLSLQVPYNGHIFWDTELWMFPPLLVLNQDIARSLVNYRSNLLEPAKQKAINYGYKGAMFPWESDDTGEEATPPFALTGPFEHHITADIGIAFWNYYRVTKNKQWLKEKGYPLMKEVADYWVSRVTKNTDGSYSINNVVGANEFAPNVNDNAFTNGAAITALKYAIKAAKELNLNEDKAWEDVANNIRILKMKDGTTKEHANYNGDIIKQADVNLLSYPLNIVSNQEEIVQDLKYYEPKLAIEGPAMGKSIFAVLYARLGDADNAFRLFKQSYQPNQQTPFGALSETAVSNNSYFATGAGGMLQTVLFGFGGLHITDNGIEQKNAILPKQWKSLTLKGIGPDKKTFVIKP
ncbi:Maltose phosphorylase / Trehalose phosphorylase [Mesoflavibacter sp. HG96]|uniref:glycosyl hydrolase family 95 catalytic domain-containing protein n=1 Tax=Mesoflavibacter TaxID=444051 RepID=UPI000D108150|nr:MULTISPECIES: glycoside hydrolase family 65 protein [Mesoflavibacter]QIJ87976.1 Maltose phosphorylase / Trehalose phosphorylase [Mesoflavibacter sp. HG96]QIJ90704.1 Maltose phosphorylase / Trehalose phosphorylase [Mesoflavibacter sp. HG37]